MRSVEYLNNKPIDEAIAIYCSSLTQAGCSLLPTMSVKPSEAKGLKTAEAVYALRSVPHFLASAMDGIALKASQTFGATETTPVYLTSDDYDVVDTGDPLPENRDAVIMIEDVINTDDIGGIMLENSATPWQHIRQIGEDFCAGDMLLATGSVVTPAAIGLMTAGGVSSLVIHRHLRVAIIPTGDEIVSAGSEPASGEITEYNGAMIKAACEEIGLRPHITDIVPDDPALLMAALESELEYSDVIMILAGSSAGRDDYSSQVIRRRGEVIIHGLAIKPGKPAILGICDNKPIIGMPGYPVSAMTIFDQIVLPVLAQLAQIKLPQRQIIEAALTQRITSSLKYKEFIRVRLSKLNSKWLATPLARGAGLLASLCRADGIIELDQNCEGLEAGSRIAVRLLPGSNTDEIAESINLIGSHDPLLDELADILGYRGIRLTSAHTGSLGGLMALRRNEALIAPIHLLDPISKTYNKAEIVRMFPDGSVVLIEGFKRIQGLITARGNPLDIKGLEDLSHDNIRYVNRQRGAGTRILLDHLLKLIGINPQNINGYSREELTHTAVAAQIAGGTADCGMAVLSAAKIYHLDFLPLAEESYDFAVRRENLDSPAVIKFIDLLSGQEIRSRLTQMGGYSWNTPGKIIMEGSDV